MFGLPIDLLKETQTGRFNAVQERLSIDLANNLLVYEDNRIVLQGTVPEAFMITKCRPPGSEKTLIGIFSRFFLVRHGHTC